jgi:hypothetical protein
MAQMIASTKIDRAALSVFRREPVQICPVTGHEKYSQLTPELKEFIDRVIVPILVKKFLAADEEIERLADPVKSAADSVSNTNYSAPGKAKP